MRLIDSDALIDKTDDRYSLGEIGRRERDDIVDALEFAPTIEPMHWIPCSERLPERSIEVLTYTALVNLIEIQSLEQDEHGFMYWENQHGDRQDLTVIAWMPLPEPWKGDAE